jgi:hypothetical protein
MKVIVTKYALTTGLYESGEGKMTLLDYFREDGDWANGYHNVDFSLNWEDAIVRAEELRIRKLQSLEKQIKKLSALKFEEPKNESPSNSININS